LAKNLKVFNAGGVLHLPSLIVQLTGGNQEGKTFAPAAGNASSALLALHPNP